ncbi:MAG: ATP-binding protein [Pseudomonadota bacterium]
MQARPKSAPVPLRLGVSAAGAALLLAATVLAGIYLGNRTQDRFQHIETRWQTYAAEAERRGELLNRIRQHLGYGGFIHNFKNYVLRQDDGYRTLLQRQLTDFTATVDEYRRSGATTEELAHLSVIRETIAGYDAMLPIADRASLEGWPPSRTDALVKVDDSAALVALAGLDSYWRNQRRAASASIAQAVTEGRDTVTIGFQFLGALVVVAILLYALFYILQRELRQTIGLLSNELAERKAAEHMAKKFQRAVDQSPATIIITDTKGQIEYVNRKFCDLTGYRPEEVLAKTPRLLQSGETPQEAYRAMRQQLARGEEWRGTFHNAKKDGEHYWAKTTILPLRDNEDRITHFIGLGEDLTERQRARDQIHRAQKMEAVGLLASGVAHDFNNVLTTILGNVHLARLDAPETGDLVDELEQIEIAAKRARNLVGQVLAFARRQPGEVRVTKIGEALREVARLMGASILPNITIRCSIEDEDLAVKADPTRLHQMIMNLCSNAAEAIGTQGGTVVLDAVARKDERGQDLVAISVTDDGPGIPDDVRAHIFDPFFTTKPVGKGTGLGLPVVANLVAEMDGQIDVRQRPGGGTVFEILISKAEAPLCETKAPERLASGTGTILLIDDEEEVLSTCAKILHRAGYGVETFTEPEAALSTFDGDPDRFCLVMTDFVMPGMNGEQVCQAIRERRRDCPVIVYTAYQPGTLDIDALEPVQILEKPVDPVMLVQTVTDMITDRRAA